MSAGADADRRSSVIELTLDPGNNCTFFVGDSGSNSNPNDAPWNSTKRTLSFWYRGEFAQCKVLLTSAAGERWIDYKFTTGTSSASGANVTFYLGTMPTTTWTRFERNVEADYESLSGSAWTNTDGLQIKLVASYSDPDMTLDDLRFSDSLTVEHNTLGPGSIGHILRHTTWDATTLAKTDRWFHYDQVGSVMNETNSAGTLATTHHMDAFGNMQLSWDSGLWDAEAEGWGFQTKERSSGLQLHYFHQRQFASATGTFYSVAPYPPEDEGRYLFGLQRPNSVTDPNGSSPVILWWCAANATNSAPPGACLTFATSACNAMAKCLAGFGIPATPSIIPPPPPTLPPLPHYVCLVITPWGFCVLHRICIYGTPFCKEEFVCL